VKLGLGTSYSYMQAGYDELPQWKRIDTEAAPNGSVRLSWQGVDGIRVTPLTSAGVRAGSDVIVPGAREVGRLVALNDGFALWSVASGPFASLCGDDWRSGIFVSTGIGAPDEAPVVERAQCWAGYCGSVLGGLVRSPGGRYAAVFVSRGDASAGTCKGAFAGTHLRVIGGSGHFVTADLLVPAHIGGDAAVLPNGSLMWAGAAASPVVLGGALRQGPERQQADGRGTQVLRARGGRLFPRTVPASNLRVT
jgi:hypothetical protein